MATRRVPGALQYAKLEDCDCTTAPYLIEKCSPPDTWLIARPALVAAQECPDARMVAISEADGEVTVYEQALLQRDQPGEMPTKSTFNLMPTTSTFNHLIDIENPQPSPYTLVVLLAQCQEDLRVNAEESFCHPMGEALACFRARALESRRVTTGGDKSDKIREIVQGMQDQMAGVVSRVAKVENPLGAVASARRETRTWIFFPNILLGRGTRTSIFSKISFGFL